MPIWEEFPYTNTHELNLDWIIKKVKDLDKLVSEAIGQNAAGTIIFANPIQWDINNDYGKYNLVLDSNYNAYLSSRDVPAGTLLSDTAYWQPVGNFAQIMELAQSNFAYNQVNDPLAAQTYNVGDLLVYNDVLYQVTSTINMGYTIDPGTNCVQVTVDDLIQALQTAVNANTNDISTINGQIVTINNTIAGMSKQVRIKDWTWYYIDTVSGNDDNNGTTPSLAFKTLDRFLKLSEEYTEIRAYIETAGTYNCTLGDNISGVSIHLIAHAAGVVVNLKTDSVNQHSIYCSHLHFEGKSNTEKMTLKADPSNGVIYDMIYTDNCMINLKWVEIPYNNFSVHGSFLDAQSCDFKQLSGAGSIITINAMNITNTDPDVTPLNFSNCQLRIIGTCTSADLSATGTVPFFKCTGLDGFIGSQILSATTNKYTYGLYAEYSYINVTTTRYNNLANNSQSGNHGAGVSSNDIFNP